MSLLMRIRIVLFYVNWGLAVGVFFIAMIFGLLLPVAYRGRLMSFCAMWVFWGLKYIVGVKYQVLGKENIPNTPCVILSKHQSGWETIAYNEIFYPVCFVLKKELTRIPFFGWGLAMAGSIAIDREGGGKALTQVIQQGQERLSQGFNIVIFPEGTRVPPGQKGTYRLGGAMLASQMNVPIIPVALNSGEFMPKGMQLKKLGMVTVSIGPAIDPTGKRPARINREVEAWIEAEMRRISNPEVYQSSFEKEDSETSLSSQESTDENATHDDSCPKS